MRQPLDIPDVGLCQEQYGVEFVPPAPEQLASFTRLCDELVEERRGLAEVDPGVAEVKPAVLYEPAYFLTMPLTPEQAATINNKEAPSIAQYCVGVQVEIARVPIEESREPMSHLPGVFSAAGLGATFSEVPFHAACGDWGGKEREFWARKGLASRLVVMGKLLDVAGVQLHVEDAYRPVGVQEGLFRRRVDWTKRDHAGWTEQQVITEAQSKTAVMPRLASHKGGAAIDARLRDVRTGELLDFGHNYPDGGALVFPRSPFITVEQWRNRQLFQVAAGLSDLTLYVGEDWHVSYGDNLASLDEHGTVRPRYIAKYGPLRDFDHSTGAITAVYEQGEMDRIFAH
jgi:D-alanyl-D-alanine dipeptidase